MNLSSNMNLSATHMNSTKLDLRGTMILSNDTKSHHCRRVYKQLYNKHFCEPSRILILIFNLRSDHPRHLKSGVPPWVLFPNLSAY